jgi:PAS domain S-box-containing protein
MTAPSELTRPARHGYVESQQDATANGWFAALADAIPHIVWSADATGAHDYANSRWTEYTGRVPIADRGAEWLELVYPDDREATRESWERALQLQEPFEYAYRLRRRDGVYRWHMSRCVPQRDTSGEVVRWFGTSTDIHDLRRTTDDLRESDRRFRDIAENIREVFWLTDENREVMYVSPAYEEIWGRSCASAYANKSDYIDGVHADDRPALLARLSSIDTEFDIEYRVVRPDGRIRWVHDRAFPVRDASGVVTRVAGIAEDITARREMEAGLQFQAHLIASVQQAIISIEPTGLVTSWNRHAETLYGWSAHEAIGRDFRELLYPVESLADGDAALHAAQTGGTFTRERIACRKDGTRMWIHVSVAPIRNRDGTVTQIVAASSDITERRRLEAQFLQAQKMEAVGRLAGGVAHDFNNLLTVITGSAEFLADAVGTENEMRKDVDEISKAAQRATGLTRQLLAFSRQQVLERRTVDPNATISQLEKMLGRLIGEDVTLLVTLDPNVPMVLADEGQLEQAVMNLVVNARDAMPHGGTMRLTTQAAMVSAESAARHGAARAGDYATIAVSDSGTGMSPDVLARIFEPFFTTKEAGRGTGLGLATVYGIVKQFGGFVDVTSTEGRGSTFTIFVPATAQSGAAAVRNDSEPVAVRGSECVLVVEDQDEVRAITRRMLTQHGYTVIEARNGSEALAIISDAATHIDLLLTDAVMPAMSGPDLIRAARPIRANLPVVVISGYTDDGFVWQGDFDAQATFLHKPFRAERLLRAVRKALSDSRRKVTRRTPKTPT